MVTSRHRVGLKCSLVVLHAVLHLGNDPLQYAPRLAHGEVTHVVVLRRHLHKPESTFTSKLFIVKPASNSLA